MINLPATPQGTLKADGYRGGTHGRASAEKTLENDRGNNISGRGGNGVARVGKDQSGSQDGGGNAKHPMKVDTRADRVDQQNEKKDSVTRKKDGSRFSKGKCKGGKVQIQERVAMGQSTHNQGYAMQHKKAGVPSHGNDDSRKEGLPTTTPKKQQPALSRGQGTQKSRRPSGLPQPSSLDGQARVSGMPSSIMSHPPTRSSHNEPAKKSTPKPTTTITTSSSTSPSFSSMVNDNGNKSTDSGSIITTHQSPIDFKGPNSSSTQGSSFPSSLSSSGTKRSPFPAAPTSAAPSSIVKMVNGSAQGLINTSKAKEGRGVSATSESIHSNSSENPSTDPILPKHVPLVTSSSSSTDTSSKTIALTSTISSGGKTTSFPSSKSLASKVSSSSLAMRDASGPSMEKGSMKVPFSEASPRAEPAKNNTKRVVGSKVLSEQGAHNGQASLVEEIQMDATGTPASQPSTVSTPLTNKKALSPALGEGGPLKASSSILTADKSVSLKDGNSTSSVAGRTSRSGSSSSASTSTLPSQDVLPSVLTDAGSSTRPDRPVIPSSLASHAGTSAQTLIPLTSLASRVTLGEQKKSSSLPIVPANLVPVSEGGGEGGR